MTDQPNRYNPSNQPQNQSLSQPPLQRTVPKTKVPANPDDDANASKETASELKREFKWFEIASLIINGCLAAVGIIALCIYHAQLRALIESNLINREALVSVQRALLVRRPIKTQHVRQKVAGKFVQGWMILGAWENSPLPWVWSISLVPILFLLNQTNEGFLGR